MGGADAVSTPSSSPTLSSFHDHLPHIQALAPVSLCLMALLSWPVCKIDQKCLGSALHQEVGVQRPQLSCPSFGPVTASCFTHCCSPGFPSRFDLLAHSGNQLQDTAFTGFLPSPVRSPLSSQCLLALKSLSQGLLLGNLKLEEKEPKFSPLQGHMEWCEALPLRKEGTGQSKGTEAYKSLQPSLQSWHQDPSLSLPLC